MPTILTRAGKASALTHNEMDTNLKQPSQTKSGAYTVAESDNRSCIEYSGSGSQDFTMPDVATVVAAADTGDFEVTIKNVGTGTLGVTNTTGADTIDGSTVDLTIGINGSVTLKANQGGDGYNVIKESRNGKQTIFVPAVAMTPTVSNGCAFLASVETTAGRPDMNVLDFDATADEHAQFNFSFPKSWDLGTVTYQAFWTSTATDTDGVSWGLQGVAVADNDTIDVVYGTAVVVDDANQSAAEDMLVSAESAAVTIAGSPAADEMCFFRVFRDVSDSNDVMTEDARLIGIKFYFTTRAVNDG